MTAVDSPRPDSSAAQELPLSLAARSDLLVSIARVLHDSGESTDDTLSTATGLGNA